jgi:hypothetical protein
MPLRFQEDDEIDRRVTEVRKAAMWLIVGILVLAGVWYGLDEWMHGGSIMRYALELGGLVGACWLGWVLYPIYQEFRIRTKEIDGKLSAAEKALEQSNDRYNLLLDRLAAIERRLDEIQNAMRR